MRFFSFPLVVANIFKDFHNKNIKKYSIENCSVSLRLKLTASFFYFVRAAYEAVFRSNFTKLKNLL
jgi:hypothetical protein